MSNKKRISKKMQKIEAKKISKFCYQIDYAGKQAEKAAKIFMNLWVNDKEKLIRIIQTDLGYRIFS
ncbi:hypothetical protein [Chryseobacterium sp. Hurlbut01]|uniref:hypothetical protein n=1 Tax=Chryseobacterium sp. Hurlbut01 TaxID=1681828 RepID=UPI00067D5774|nr:hypothetical protein [Chryseobacterium sp. Hurlbut01]KNB60967.1 hypothetical protein AC804_17635 [Chryseobacterium sp. Hurlbut01]